MSGATMNDILYAFRAVIDFAQTKVFFLGEYPVTFWQIWVWTVGGTTVLAGIKAFYDTWS